MDRAWGIANSPGADPVLPPFHQVSTFRRKFNDPVVDVPVGNENAAVLRHVYVRDPVERVLSVSGDARRAERHENLALRTELVDLLASPVVVSAVCEPDVPLATQVQAMGPHEHPFAPGHQQFPGRIKLEQRWLVSGLRRYSTNTGERRRRCLRRRPQRK